MVHICHSKIRHFYTFTTTTLITGRQKLSTLQTNDQYKTKLERNTENKLRKTRNIQSSDTQVLNTYQDLD